MIKQIRDMIALLALCGMSWMWVEVIGGLVS